ncbi:MAG: hypothetical protein L0H55_10465 [Candidatus Nitrosocosmicus sp.]|nr:hypothetical protein [Candidatus Nitrosocosmicus sp.]
MSTSESNTLKELGNSSNVDESSQTLYKSKVIESNPRASITYKKYQKSIADRRKKVNDLLMKGYSQQEIMSKLHLSQSTASRDISYLYNQTERASINLGKVAFEELHKSLNGTTELLKRGWDLLEKTSDNRKLQLKIMEYITNCYQRRTELIQAGPVLLYLDIQTKRFSTIERFLEKNHISIDEYTLKAIMDTAQKDKEMDDKRRDRAVF